MPVPHGIKCISKKSTQTKPKTKHPGGRETHLVKACHWNFSLFIVSVLYELQSKHAYP